MPLNKLLESQPGRHSSGPPISYPEPTELTRNPASTRSTVEKNWFLFFPTPSTSYIHYDLSPPPPSSIPSNPACQDVLPDHPNPVRRHSLESLLPTNSTHLTSGRTFAKLLRNGHTTPNLTTPLEQPCLRNEPDSLGQPDHCTKPPTHSKSSSATATKPLLEIATSPKRDAACTSPSSTATSAMSVPSRCATSGTFAVWEARPPFQMLGVSRYPVLFRNERASG